MSPFDMSSRRDGDRVRIWPTVDNPIHSGPVMATYYSGLFFCDGTDPTAGPDYAIRDLWDYAIHLEWCND